MKFKYGVSDWTFLFDNNMELKINTIKQEILSYDCSGRIKITLVIAELKDDIIEIIKNNVGLINVTRESTIIENNKNITDNTKKIEVEDYKGLNIRNVSVMSKDNNFSKVIVTLGM